MDYKQPLKSASSSRVNAEPERRKNSSKAGTDRVTSDPIYAKLKRAIVDRIAAGAWKVGEQIPSETDFMREFGASRMTINRSLRELSIEGVLVRMQGVGTFVAEDKGQSILFEVRSIADEIEQGGHAYCAKIISAGRENCPLSASDALGLAPNAPVFHTVIVHHRNQIPVQLEDRFVNPAVAPHYLSQNFESTTPNRYLMKVAPLSAVVHVVEAVLPSRAESRLLKVDKAEPCLLIKRTTWSGRDVASTVRLLYPGARYRLESGRVSTPVNEPPY